MLTAEFLKHFISLHANTIYLLVIVGVLTEGEIVAILAGALTYIGSLNIAASFLAVVLGALGKSVIGYAIGYYLKQKHSHRPMLCNVEKQVNRFLPAFMERPFIFSLLSWFLVLGIKWFALIYVGYKQYKVSLFAKAEIPALLIWSVVVFFFGYFFSFTALSISHQLQRFSILLLTFLVCFFIIERLITFIIGMFTKENSK
jgi:membrane protein DedA with SNARE-associated domain